MMDFSDYKNVERVFHYFSEISKIPHGSENTAPIADYLESFAEAKGLWHYRDGKDNVIIRKAATDGYENRPTVIIQGHTDMVADKVADCKIDMLNEGLDIYRDGDFIRARGTTLGADDGIAIAYALALLESDEIAHPEIEALFTSDEEIGLIGATSLDTSHLRGKIMINIDSDEEGVFTVGCAGGMRIDARRKCTLLNEEYPLHTITLSGLRGGHSGVEIDKGRINAIKALMELVQEISGILISSVSGGNADNAIARTSSVTFYAPTEEIEKLKNGRLDEFAKNYKRVEPDISVTLTPEKNGKVFTKNDTKCILNFANGTPYGVIRMSEEIEGLPESSANLGIVQTEKDEVIFSSSIRSSVNYQKSAIRDSIFALAKNCGFEFSARGEYPAWEYKKDSCLRDVMCRVYKEMYNKDAQVITIHAGLECGIFSEKIEGLDCVSIGPDNFDIHTPDEHLSISSSARVWEYLKHVLAEI